MAIVQSIGLLVVVVVALLLDASAYSTCPEGCQCSTRTTTVNVTVNCTNASLGHIPQALLDDTCVLIISDDTIPVIRKNTFTYQNSRSLQILLLQRNKIRTLEPHTFAGLTKLVALFLPQNELVNLTSGMFQGMKSLKKLGLTDNKIENIDRNSFQGLTDLTELFLSGNMIKKIEHDLFVHNPQLEVLMLNDNENLFLPVTPLEARSLKRLNMTNCGIIELSASVFHGAQNLQSINLAENALMTLDHKVFVPLQMLKHVNLDGNSLECDCHLKRSWTLLSSRGVDVMGTCEALNGIEEHFFDKVTDMKCQDMCKTCKCSKSTVNCSSSNLDDLFLETAPNSRFTTIDASYNKVEFLYVNMFGNTGLPRLKSLLLNHNRISKIEEGAFKGLNNVEKLDLTHNNINVIKNGVFRELENLTTLALAFNNITHLEVNGLQGLVNLKTLDMGNNNMAGKPADVFRNVIQLHSLSLARNNLVSLQPNIFNHLINLLELNLNSNQINRMHNDAFKNLTKLLILDLSNNKMSTLSKDVFSDLHNLRTLNLSNNIIIFLSTDHLRGLRRLTDLNLRNNTIAHIEPQAFSNLFELTILNLANNSLDHMEPETFRNLTKLSIFNLEQNEIKVIDKDLFKDLHNLQILYLRANNVKGLYPELFQNCPTLFTLDLSENNLTTVNVAVLDQLTSLKVLELLANPLECDCQLKATYHWCDKHKVTARAMCNGPAKFAGYKWEVLGKMKCKNFTEEHTSSIRPIITTELSIYLTNTTMESTVSTRDSEGRESTVSMSTTPAWEKVGETTTGTDKHVVFTTGPTEESEEPTVIMPVLNIPTEEYTSYNASFSQPPENDAKVSSIILYLLITLCVLFCILAGLLAKFVFKNRRSKNPSSNDISSAGEPESEIGSIRHPAEPTGIENLNFDDSKPATTGPICLPMITIDTSGIKENHSSKSNHFDRLKKHQQQEVAIVHQEQEK